VADETKTNEKERKKKKVSVNKIKKNVLLFEFVVCTQSFVSIR